MAHKLKPLHDRVVVERSEAEEKTAGGIVLPDSAQDKPKQGTVIAVGTGRILDTGKSKPIEVKVGERVLFGAYAGSEVKVSGKEYLVMTESDILAVISEGKSKKR